MNTDKIIKLNVKQQILFCALTCEKMLYIIIKYDEHERNKGREIFEDAIRHLYSLAMNILNDINEHEEIRENIDSFCPDLDESTNDYAPYALDACSAFLESLDFMIDNETEHVLNCATAATDVVDMYVQMASEVEPPPMPQLEAFISSNPFMIKERRRQELVLEEITKLADSVIDTELIAYLRIVNGEENIFDLDLLQES